MKHYAIVAAVISAGAAVSTNVAVSARQLSPVAVRAFVEAQNRAWSARDARARWLEETSMVENGKPRLLHATAEEELAWRGGRIVALRLTEKR